MNIEMKSEFFCSSYFVWVLQYVVYIHGNALLKLISILSKVHLVKEKFLYLSKLRVDDENENAMLAIYRIFILWVNRVLNIIIWSIPYSMRTRTKMKCKNRRV